MENLLFTSLKNTPFQNQTQCIVWCMNIASRTAKLYFNNSSDREEVCQMTLLRICKYGRSFSGENCNILAGWVKAITKNVCYDLMRTNKLVTISLDAPVTEEGALSLIDSIEDPHYCSINGKTIEERCADGILLDEMKRKNFRV